MPELGSRVRANIPGGVGELVESVVPIDDFMVDDGTGNFGKFGDLLANVKDVSGEEPEIE